MWGREHSPDEVLSLLEEQTDTTCTCHSHYVTLPSGTKATTRFSDSIVDLGGPG